MLRPDVRPTTLDSRKVRAAEVAVRNHPEIFRLLVDAVTDYAIYAIDREGYIMTWNPGAERLKGYPAAEVIGTHFSRFYLGADLERRHPEFELARATADGRYEEEAWRIRKDGARFWASIVLTKLHDREGRHVGFTKVTRDLTERKIVEERLRASEERLRLMIEGVSDYAIIMLNPSGQVTTWNSGARRILGFANEEILGSSAARFYLEDETAAGRPGRDLELARSRGHAEGEGWRVRRDGTQFWAHVTLKPIFADSGQLLGYSSVTRDLTERRRTERLVAEAQGDLKRRIDARTAELARAVRARDEFVSIASHELKTPLTSLKLATQLRLRYLDLGKLDRFTPELLRDMLVAEEKQINRLTRLVDDMLDLSRLNLGKFVVRPETCELGPLLANLVARFGELHPSARIRLNIEGAISGLWDAFRLEQVCTNLLTNALRYGAGSPIEVQVERLSDVVRIKVRDEGPGVPAVDRERIFQAFERAVTASEACGLGLGLFISRQIAEAHGGTLTLDADSLGGTVFTLALPLGVKP